MKQILSGLLVSAVFLVSCSGAGGAPAPNSEAPDANSGAEVVVSERHVPAYARQNSPYTTLRYNLGNAQMQQAPMEVTYAVQGVLSLPKGAAAPAPLVLILHGSHENIEENARYDEGFAYLCEALAQNGYAAASIDLGVAYLWHLGENDLAQIMEITNQHLERLAAANAGENPEYAMVQDTIDFDSIVLLGHSRGGGAIFEIAEQQPAAGSPVRGLIAVAPTLMAAREEFADIPAHILVPEYDGDISDWQGYYFSYALRDNGGQAATSLTLLERANHNFFNAKLEQNDAQRLGLDGADQLPREEQQQFLIDYTLSALDNIFTNNQTVFTPAEQSATTLFGQDASTIFYQPDRDVLFHSGQPSAAVAGANTTAEPVVDSWFFPLDTAHFFESLTFGDGPYQTKDLLRVGWQAQGGALTIAPAVGDFSARQALVLEIALDSAQFTQAPELLVTLTLTDAKGNSRRVTVPQEERALRYIPGEKETMDTTTPPFHLYSRNTPIMGVSVPLENWEGVDLAEIKTITMEFQQAESGAVFLEGCYLV